MGHFRPWTLLGQRFVEVWSTGLKRDVLGYVFCSPLGGLGAVFCTLFGLSWRQGDTQARRQYEANAAPTLDVIGADWDGL